MDGQRTQLLRQVANLEHHEGPIQLDIGGTGEQPGGEGSVDEAFETDGQAGGDLARQFAQCRREIVQDWSWPGMRGWI